MKNDELSFDCHCYTYLIDFITHALKFRHLLHLAQFTLLDPLLQLIVQNGFFLEVCLVEAVCEQPSQVKILVVLILLLMVDALV